MLYTTVALSVVLGFICTEFTGLLTGGLISAGYLAYYFQEPSRLASTLVLSLVIYLVVQALKHVLILYGRRRFMLNVVLSLLAVWLVQKTYFYVASASVDLRVIGYIIPGLIANDMEKQGIVRTVCALGAVVVIIRLVAMLGAL